MTVELRKWTLEDKELIANICNNIDRKYLRNVIPYPYMEADADWWLNRVQEREGISGIYRAIVVDGNYVGNISVEQHDDVSCKEAEVGYVLLTEYWGKGVMTESVKEICRIAFEELDIIRIEGRTYSPNFGSQRVLEKNGFTLDGIMRQAIYKNGNIYDAYIYSLIKSYTWEQNGIQLRRYKPEDMPEIAELFYDTINSVNIKDYTEEQVKAWSGGYKKLLRRNDYFEKLYTIVAVRDDKIIGFGNMDNTGYLDFLYVHRDYQGIGVATMLCDELERYISVQGIKEITVHASITARTYFEHRGYEVEKEQQVVVDDVSLTNYAMKKEISK